MRFWIALLVLAAVNLAGWMIDWRAVLQRRPDLAAALIDVDEDGEVMTSAGAAGTELRLRFDRGMTTAGEPAGAFVPGLAGRWRWDDERTAVFRADAPLAAATRYTLTPDRERMVAADGARLPAATALRFHTEALRLRDVRSVDRSDDGREIIELAFNQEVLPQEAAKAAILTHPDGSPMPLEPAGDAPTAAVRLRTAPLPDLGDLVLALRLPQGFAGTAGPLGLESAASAKIPISRAVRCTSAGFAEVKAPQPGWDLVLRFNRPVRPDAVVPRLALVPAVAVVLAEGDPTAPANRIALRGDFVQGARYAISLPALAGGTPAEALYATPPDRRPSCRFASEGGHLGSLGHRSVGIETCNLRQVRLRAWRLYDSNLVSWRTTRWIRDLSRPVAERVIRIDAGANREAQLTIALDDLLGGHADDGVYRLELAPDRHDVLTAFDGWLPGDDCVVSLSDLALSARHGADGVTVWATSLASGRPVPGARIALFSSKQQPLGSATTGDDGLARIVPHPDPDDRAAVLLGSLASGLTWLDLREQRLRDPGADTGGRPWTGQEAFVHPDRGLMRPGETTHWRAIVRTADGAVPAPFPVRWQAWRPDGRLFRSADAILDRDGCAGLDLEVPDAAMTGRWRVTLAVPGGAELGGDGLLVEDIIPDRLAVTLDLPAPGDEPRLAPADCDLTVHGDWLFGAPAAGCAATLAVRLDPAGFSHPAWTEWVAADLGDVAEQAGLHNLASGDRLPDPPELKLDAAGRAVFHLDLAAALRTRTVGLAARPWRLAATAGVLEAGGRGVSTARAAWVDPVPAYLLLRSAAASAGAPCRIDLRLVRPDGGVDPGAAAAELRLFRERWETAVVRRDGHYDYTSNRILEPVGAAVAVAIAAGAGSGEVIPPDGGTFIVLARVPGGPLLVSTRLTAGAEAWQDSIARGRPEHAEVAPAQPPPPAGCVPGIPVAFDIKSPFPGTLLLTVEGDRVLSTRVIALTAPATRIEVVPEASWGGTAYITATIVRQVEPDQPWRVHRAFGVCPLRLTQEARRAVVAVEAPAEVLPGGDLACAVRIGDPAGAPLADAAVTIAAVDEGILRPAAFRTPDPFAFFAGKRLLAVEACDAYADLMPEAAKPGGASEPGGDEAVSARHRPPVAARRVVPVALWSGVVRSGADGVGHASFTLPGSFSGRLRIMAVAAAGARCGAAAAPCAVRGPVLVQASLPRFLAPGDRARIPVSVFNQGEAGEAEVAVACEGAAQAQPATQRVHVAAHGSAVAWIDLTAAAAMGPATFTASATLAGATHRERTELPVRPAVPVETVGGSLVLTPGKEAAITAPEGFLPGGWRTARVVIEPAPDLGVPLAIERLLAYPHGCAEQTVSAGLALVRLPEFLPEGSRPAVATRLAAGLARLGLMATRDGGLAMWPGERSAWPWASVYALHLLHEAAAAGYPVPGDLREHLIAYAKAQLGRNDADELATRCYAAHVLALHGQPQPAALARLAAEVRQPQAWVTPECTLHLAAAWLAAGDRVRAAALVPEGIAPRRDRRDGGDCGSGTRDRAVALLALTALDPQRPEAARLARELADPRLWGSTQDTAWAVLALGRWRATTHATPYTSAHLSAGGRILDEGSGSVAWDGQALPEALGGRIDGEAGAVGYLSWTASGIPSAVPGPLAEGLSVERSWSIDPARIRRGDLVTVSLRIAAPDGRARRNVVAEDLLPAGFEIENPRLATSAAQGAHQTRTDDVAPSHVEIRDDRLVLVGDLPARRAITHQYLVRAVAAGTFALPPLAAECMYDREVRARAGAGTLLIAER